MTQDILDGRVSRLGKLDGRYWYYFRQGDVEYGVRYEGFEVGLKPVNFNYERALQRHASGLARSKKRSRRFKLPAYVDTVQQDGENLKVKLFVRGPINQTIEMRFRPNGMPAADMGFAVVAVMEKIEKNENPEK